MYRNQPPPPNQSPLAAWKKSGFPLTIALIAINFLTMALVTFRLPVASYFCFLAPSSLQYPWTFLTYPLVSLEVIGCLFYSLWLYFIGGSLERGWGTRFYGMYFFLMALISAAGLMLGSLILKVEVFGENWLAISAVTLAWCMLNPNEVIRFNFFIPIKAKWLALLEVIIIFFTYARIHPLMGFFALSGCAASYAWVRYRPWAEMGHYTVRRKPRTPKSVRPKDDRFTLRDLNPIERIARARRKKQFERLMKDD